MLTIKTTVDLSGCDRFQARMLAGFEKLVAEIAYSILELAQYQVPQDQGVAKDSGFVSLGANPSLSEENLASAIEKATKSGGVNASRYGHKGRKVEFSTEEVNSNPELQNYLAYISFTVIYAEALELGTIQNPDPMSVAATNPGAQRPFLSPAVEHFESLFLDGIKKVMSVA